MAQQEVEGSSEQRAVGNAADDCLSFTLKRFERLERLPGQNKGWTEA